MTRAQTRARYPQDDPETEVPETEVPRTPFARELQQWLWTGRGPGKPPISRRQLARDYVHLPYATVEGWFRADLPGAKRSPSYPEPEAFWRLVKVTGWTPEHLAALCGYSELPPHVLGIWDYLREQAPARFDDSNMLAVVIRWLDDMERRYDEKPKRPDTRRRGRKALDTRKEQQASTGK